MIDRDLHKARALLIEGNALLRSVAIGQLHDVGIGHVTPCARVRDARVLLEQERFDVVLCNREFEGSDISGQDLLDELRREQILPLSTVFLMMVAQPTYHEVAEAAESALDGVIVRPFTTAALADRLLEARQRKRALADVLQALDGGELEQAFARALRHFQEGQTYADSAGRIAADLLLRLNRPADACTLFDKLAQRRATAWVRLGLARAQLASGDAPQARRTVVQVIADEPGSADAHEAMGRLQWGAGELEAAADSLERSVEITPGCLVRRQLAGRLAQVLQRTEAAAAHLDRARVLGVGSRLFDPMVWLCLAWSRAGDREALQNLRSQLARACEAAPEDSRLRRLDTAVQVLEAALAGPAAPSPAWPALAEGLADAQADALTGQVIVGTLARIDRAAWPAEHEIIVTRVGMRYCSSRGASETLAGLAGPSPDLEQRLRACHGQVQALAERAVEASMRGDPVAAAERLVEEAERTLNARLVETAAVIARRHVDRHAGLAAVQARCDALMARLADPSGGLPLGRRFGPAPVAR